MKRHVLPLLLPALLYCLGCSVDMDRQRPGDSSVADSKTKLDLHQQDIWKPDRAAGDIEAKDAVQDQGGPTGVVLVQGGFSTAGPGSGGSVVLVEGGFEMGEQLCNTGKNICVTGGIVP